MVKTFKKKKSSFSISHKKNKKSVRNKLSKKKHKSIYKANRNRKQIGGNPIQWDVYDSVEELNIDDVLAPIQSVFLPSGPVRVIPVDVFDMLMATIHNNPNLKTIIAPTIIITREAYDRFRLETGLIRPLFEPKLLLEGLFMHHTPSSFIKLQSLDSINLNNKSYLNFTFNTDILINFFLKRKSFKIKQLQLEGWALSSAGLYNLCVLELLGKIETTELQKIYKFSDWYRDNQNFNEMRNKLKEGLQKKQETLLLTFERFKKQTASSLHNIYAFGQGGLDTPGVIDLTYESAISNDEILSCCCYGMRTRDVIILKLFLQDFKKELIQYFRKTERESDNLFFHFKLLCILLMNDVSKVLRSLKIFFSWAISFKLDNLRALSWSKKDKERQEIDRQYDFLSTFLDFSRNDFFQQCEHLMLTDKDFLQQIFPSLTPEIIAEYNKPTRWFIFKDYQHPEAWVV